MIEKIEPTNSSNNNEKKFETYRFYLESFCQQIDVEYSSWEDFCKKALFATTRYQGFPGFDITWIKRWMKIAWNTEYLMTEETNDCELIRFNNQWKPIQAYYSVYAACEAMAYTLDGNRADGHKKAIRKITGALVNLSLCPWNNVYKGSWGKGGQDHFPVNFPNHLNLPNNLQRNNVKPIEMIAKCLKVEHQHRIDDKFQVVKNKGREYKCYKYNIDPGLTGIIHFLYRLRVKSNYKDVEIFILDASKEKIIGFSKSLEKIVQYTLSLLEIILIRKCKKNFLLNLMDEYLGINTNSSILEKRRSYYKKNI